MIKKLLSVILVGVFVLAMLSGCGKKQDLTPILGDWIYEQNDTIYTTGDPGDFFTEVAMVLVRADGTFSAHWTFEDYDHEGIVKIEYEEYSDGSKVPMYSFYENGNEFWFSCPCEQEDPDIFVIGQEGLERLTRNKGQG